MNHKLLSLALLGIVVPVGLLATFRITGILQGPITISETTTLETVKWEFERPNLLVNIRDRVENLYNADDVSMVYSILIGHYHEGPFTYDGVDYLSMAVNVTATALNGYIESVYVVYCEDHERSLVALLEKDNLIVLGNLSIQNLADAFAKQWLLKNDTKAFMSLTGVDHPSSVYVYAPTHWILRSPNKQSHQMEIVSEVTYYNGTAYKKVVMSTILRVIADAGNSFEAARTIGFGNHTAFIHVIDDSEDYYKIRFDENQTISIQLSIREPRQGLYLDLYLYDPDENLVASSCSRKPNNIEKITYTVNQSGDWYIRVLNPYAGYTLYTLSIEVKQP